MSLTYHIPLKDRPDALVEVASAFGEANVNILGLALGNAILRIAVDDDEKAPGILGAVGVAFTTHEAFPITRPNQPGEFADAVRKLRAAGIQVNHAMVQRAAYGMGTDIVVEVDDVGKAREILG